MEGVVLGWQFEDYVVESADLVGSDDGVDLFDVDCEQESATPFRYFFPP